MQIEALSCEDFLASGQSEPVGLETCEGVIIPQRGEGEACGTPLEDEDGNQSGYLRSSSACTEGLYCADGENDTEPSCAPIIALGEACEAYDDDACGDAFGINEICTDQLLDEGEVCIDDEHCTSGTCDFDNNGGDALCIAADASDVCEVPDFGGD